jgi:hypothetical protein
MTSEMTNDMANENEIYDDMDKLYYEAFRATYDEVQKPMTEEKFKKLFFEYSHSDTSNLSHLKISKIDFFVYETKEKIKNVSKEVYVLKKSFIMPMEDLFNYISNFCLRYIKNKYNIKIAKFYEDLCENFINSYNLKSEMPELTAYKFSSPEHSIFIKFDMFMEDIKIKYIRETEYDEFGNENYTYEGYIADIYNYDLVIASFFKFLKNYPENFRVKVENFFNFDVLFVDDANLPDKDYIEGMNKLSDELYSILSEKKGEYFPLKELSLDLTISSKSTIKPVTTHILKSIVTGSPFFFSFDEEGSKVRVLNDDEVIHKIETYFKNNQKGFSEFPETIESPGLIAVTFIGSNFPFKEAAEYVKTRPVIFIGNVPADSRLEDYISFSDEDLNNPGIPDIKYLKIFDLKDTVKTWIENNCVISFLPYDRDKIEFFSGRIKILFPKLMEKLSPILNLSNNPFNPFEYTLSQKINDFIKVSKG